MSARRKIQRREKSGGVKKVARQLDEAMTALTKLPALPDGTEETLQFLQELEKQLPDMARDVQMLVKRQEKTEGALRVLIRRVASPDEVPELIALLDGE